VLDSHGKPAETWVNQDINGPWDMTMRAQAGHAALFISNVLTRPASAGSAPPLVPHGAGDLFSVTPLADSQGLLFVNDGTNALDLFSARGHHRSNPF